MTDEEIERLSEELNEFDSLHKIKSASWSIYEVNGEKWTIERFKEKHPFQQCNRLLMRAYDGTTRASPHSRIHKTKHTTWLDLYKLCDKRISLYKSDHRFIEGFTIQGKLLILETGS